MNLLVYAYIFTSTSSSLNAYVRPQDKQHEWYLSLSLAINTITKIARSPGQESLFKLWRLPPL